MQWDFVKTPYMLLFKYLKLVHYYFFPCPSSVFLVSTVVNRFAEKCIKEEPLVMSSGLSRFGLGNCTSLTKTRLAKSVIRQEWSGKKVIVSCIMGSVGSRFFGASLIVN